MSAAPIPLRAAADALLDRHADERAGLLTQIETAHAHGALSDEQRAAALAILVPPRRHSPVEIERRLKLVELKIERKEARAEKRESLERRVKRVEQADVRRELDVMALLEKVIERLAALEERAMVPIVPTSAADEDDRDVRKDTGTRRGA